jgi:hypothetical protein
VAECGEKSVFYEELQANDVDLFHVHKHIPGKYQIKNLKYKAS